MFKKKAKEKTLHSMPSNIFFFVKMLFSVSPLLVLGEFMWGLLMILPNNLIRVIGVKYIIDVVTEGKDLERIFFAVVVIALVLICSTVISWLSVNFIGILNEKSFIMVLIRSFMTRQEALTLSPMIILNFTTISFSQLSHLQVIFKIC